MLVGLNPIVLVWGLGGDHNDFLIVFAIVLGFYLLLRARAAGAPSAAGDARVVERTAGSPDAQLVERAAGTQTSSAEPRAGMTLSARIGGWLWPLSAVEMGAGAAFVAATALKASGGVLIPIVLASLVRAPRRLTQVLLGMVLAGVVVGGASLIAFGLHIPDLSTQSQVVTSDQRAQSVGSGARQRAGRPKRCTAC